MNVKVKAGIVPDSTDPTAKSEDIRWLQRFQNYQKSLGYLTQAIDVQKPDVVQRAGLIQFFQDEQTKS